MRNYVIHLAVIMALPFSAKSQASSNYTVKGILPAYGKSTEKTYAVLALGTEVNVKEQECEITNGTFSFRGTTSQPVESMIKIIRKGAAGDTMLELRSFWLEKGTIGIKGHDSLGSALISGSLTNMQADSFQALLLPKSRLIDSLFAIKRSSKVDSTYKKNVIDPALKNAVAGMEATIKSFIASHPESFLSLQLLDNLMHVARQNKSRNMLDKSTIAEFDKLYNNLHPAFKSMAAGKNTKAALNGLKAANVGDEVVHFALKGIDGKVVNTRSLSGKVFLIDFWGSWCGWCREGHPHLKELYSKYKPQGFEIIGISKEYDHDKSTQIKKWKKAVADDGINWLHVLSETGSADLVTAFGVGAYPTKVLVDRNGKILLRVTDDKERALDKMLEELFNTNTQKL